MINFRRLIAAFTSVWMIQTTNHIQSDRDNKLNMVVNMLHNWSRWYFSHYRIIKCVGFELMHYDINLNGMSSSTIFGKFDFVFLLNGLLI